MEKREQKFKSINRILIVASILFAIGMAIYNMFYSTPYYIMLSLCTLPMICIPFLAYWVLRLKPVPSLTFAALVFILLAYGVGMVLDGFHTIPLYDKVVHLLSGVFFALIGLLVFYLLKKDKKIAPSDWPGAVYCCISFAALSAVLWEILEFILNLILKNDAQNVLTTGVNDTMLDMIACLIGAILLSISVIVYYRKGKKGILVGVFTSFYQENFLNN